jgi:peroxin-2
MNTSQKVLRVTQLDTQELDDEFNLLINKSLNEELLKYLNINTKYNKQILNIINIIIWYFTYFKNNQTIGQSTLEWKYLNNNNNNNKLINKIQLITHLLINNNLISLNSINDNNKLKLLYKLINLINYLIFLINGDYLFIWLRIFKLKSYYTNKIMFINNEDKQLNNRITERELLWHSYFQLIKFLNKIFNLKQLLNKLNRKTKLKSNQLINANDNGSNNKCSICNDSLKIPCKSSSKTISNCTHLFCYYCIKSYLNLNDYYSCTKCSCLINDFNLLLITS